MTSGAVTGSLPAGRVTDLRAGADEHRERLDLARGPLPATLIVAGLPLADLAAGTRLRIGGAVLELGGEPAGTGVADAAEPAVPLAARVVEAGVVRRGDAALIEAVAVPLEDALDLHPFAPAEIAAIVAEYLACAHAAGLAEVRLIHGRGRGVQRETVRRVLGASPLVVAFADSPPERGGWGATIVRLRS
jgi:hypothetical protein